MHHEFGVATLRTAPGMRERSPGAWELIVEAGRDPVTGKRRQASRIFNGTGLVVSGRLVAVGREPPAQSATLEPAHALSSPSDPKFWEYPSSIAVSGPGCVTLTALWPPNGTWSATLLLTDYRNNCRSGRCSGVDAIVAV